MSDRWKQSPHDISLLEAALLDDPVVADCAVLDIPVEDGPRRIAYVVARRPLDPSQVLRNLVGAAPEIRPPEAVVPVRALPLRADGTLEEDALFQLPLVDEAVARCAEDRLARQPGVEHAAVFVVERGPSERRLHLDRLVPAMAAPVAHAGHTDEARDESARTAGPGSPRPSAMVSGPELVVADDAPDTLPAALERAAERHEDARMLHVDDDGTEHSQSFTQLLLAARRVLGALRAHGLRPGDFVLFQLVGSRDILSAFWGCLLGGFVPVVVAVPASFTASTGERDKICHVWRLLSGPLLLTSAALRPALLGLRSSLPLEMERVVTLEELLTHAPEGSRHRCHPDDVAFLSLTSGSTGAPKGIQLTHKNILARARGANALCAHAPSDVILNWLPFDHIGSMSDWHLRCVDLGCRMVYCSKERVLAQPLEWLRLIQRYRITHSWAPNFAFALINSALQEAGSESWDLSSMKALLTAGEAVSSSTVEEFLPRLAPHGLRKTAVRPAFGMAELGSGVTYFQPTDAQPLGARTVDRASLATSLVEVSPQHPRSISFTSLGPPIPGMSMRVVDDDHRVLPEATIGRLHVRGDAVSPGYYRNEDANRVFLDEGWFETGDQGFIADGELYLTGRSKDCIIINGANFFPVEIENVVEEVPGVVVSFTAAYTVRPPRSSRECLAVFFSPGDVGEAALAPLLRDVQERVSQKIGITPDYLVPLPERQIPKTSIGKIRRKELAARFEAGEFDGLVRRTDLLLGNQRTVPDWFARPTWHPRLLRPVPFAEAAGTTVVLLDQTGLGRRLCALHGVGQCFEVEPGPRLERLGDRRYRATATSAPELAALLRDIWASSSGRVLDVVDLRAYGRAPAAWDRGAVESRMQELWSELEALLGALATVNAAGARVRLLVVSSHGQPVHDDDRPCPAQSILPPLLLAAAGASEWLEVRHIDLPAATHGGVEENARHLASELSARSHEAEVAYRDGLRFVPRLADVAFADSPGVSALRQGGLYLVTGGLGGVGVEIARRLLSDLDARVLLVGRTPLDQGGARALRGRSADPRASRLRELGSLGPAEYVALDVGDAEALARTVAQAEARWHTTLTGVFHLAGVARERTLLEESWESVRQVLAPKVFGALAVDRILARRPEAFVVHFSSVESRFPSSTTGAYAAANRFLETFSRRERRELGRRSYCIAWSSWEGVGMSSRGNFDAALRARGLSALPAKPAMTSLLAAMALPATDLLVGIERQSPGMQAMLGGPAVTGLTLSGFFTARAGASVPPQRLEVTDLMGRPVPVNLERLSVAPLTESGVLAREELRARVATGPASNVPPRSDLERAIAAMWKEVLGATSVSITDSFFDLGGTSLLSIRLFAMLEARLGRRLPASTLFEAPTIERLAALIGEEQTGSGDCLVPLARGERGDAALFLVHDVDGETVLYATLARLLEHDLPVYGIRPYGHPETGAVHTRIAEMASCYVDRIRQEQPRGPYFLGGLCSGGVVAFEMSCQLQDMGEEVALLALLDSTDPMAVPRSTARQKGERFVSLLRSRELALGARVGAAIEKIRNLAVYEACRRSRDLYDRARLSLLRHYADRDLPLPGFLPGVTPRTVYHFAQHEYSPGLFRGRLTLFRASQRLITEIPNVDDTPAIERCGDPLLGWHGRATGGVEVIDVGGGHSSMLQEPHVRAVAQALRERVAAARRSRPNTAAPRPLCAPDDQGRGRPGSTAIA